MIEPDSGFATSGEWETHMPKAYRKGNILRRIVNIWTANTIVLQAATQSLLITGIRARNLATARAHNRIRSDSRRCVRRTCPRPAEEQRCKKFATIWTADIIILQDGCLTSSHYRYPRQKFQQLHELTIVCFTPPSKSMNIVKMQVS